MKIYAVADQGEGELSTHYDRKGAEGEAESRGGSGGTWSDAPGSRKYTGPRKTIRVVETYVKGDPPEKI